MSTRQLGGRARCRWCRQPIEWNTYMGHEGPATWRHITPNGPPLLTHLRDRPSYASCGALYAEPSPDIDPDPAAVLAEVRRIVEAWADDVVIVPPDASAQAMAKIAAALLREGGDR